MGNKILYLKNIFLIILLWFVAPEDIRATHIVGGNLTYKHISGTTYQVKLVLRRDCFLGSPEAQFDDPAAIGIFTNSGALAIWLGLNGQIKIPFMSSDTLNEYIQSDCGFEGTQVCVHETTYLGNVNLPTRPGGYILAYQRCCRNATLNNVLNPLETGSTYWIAVTDQSLSLKNSTPTFNKWPDVYICANKPLVFDHSATDTEADSLVYKLCLPSLGATKLNPKPQPPGFPPYVGIAWAPPYSLADMMGGVPLQIDSKTGEITATPNLVGQFLVGVCVEEYRNGVLLSTVRRDFQFNVRVCSQPPFAQFTTSESDCDGLTVEFYNNSLSSSAYQWDFNFPSSDSVFKSTLANPVFTFPQSGIYDVRLRATRGSDGCFDTIIKQVSVFENKIVPDFKYTLSACSEENDSLILLLSDESLFEEPGYVINDRKWKVIQNGNVSEFEGESPYANVSYLGDVEVQLEVFTSNGCKSLITKQIKISDVVPKLDFKIEYVGCPANDSIQIRLINISASLNQYATIKSSSWIVENNEYFGDSVIVGIPFGVNTTNIVLKTSFFELCNVMFSKSIDIIEPPIASFTATNADCQGLTIGFSNNSLNTGVYEWNFNFPDGSSTFKSTEINPEFTFPAAGLYQVWLKSIRQSDGCSDTIVQTVGVFENKIVPDFVLSLSDCQTDSLRVTLTDNTFFEEPGFELNSWQWSVVQNGQEIIYSGNPVEIPLQESGNLEVSLQVFASNGCISDINKQFNLSDIIPELDFDYTLEGCPSDSVATIKIFNQSAPLNPFALIDSSVWIVNNQEYTGDTILVSLPNSTGEFTVKLKVSFAGNCVSEEVKIFDLSEFVPKTAYTYSPVSCPDGDNVKISLQYLDTSANNIQLSDITWLAGTNTNQNVFNGNAIEIIIPKDSLLVFNMTTTFVNGCVDKLSNSFLPGPFATLKFIADPILLCQGDSKQILTNANPDWTYIWSPTDGLDFSDPSGPKVMSDSNRTYHVTVTDGLCSVTDSVSVIIRDGGIFLDILPDTVTCDGNVVLSVSGGIGPGVYSWGTEPTVTQVIGTGQTISTNFNGNEQTYYVKFFGETCSTTPAAIKVTNQLPSIEDLSPVTLCREDTLKLTTINLIPGHDNSFAWQADDHIISGANTPNPVIKIEPTESQSFYLTYNVTNQYGCTLQDSIQFIIGENPVADFNFDLTKCGDYQICFNVIGSFEGFAKWDFGDPTTTNDKSIEKSPCYTYPDNGEYQVTLTNLVGVCPFEDIIKTIKVNPQIRLNNIPDPILCKGDSISFSATSNLQDVLYTWTDESGTVLASGPGYSGSFDNDSTVIVTGKDIFGCTDSDTISVNIFKFDYTVDIKDSLCVNEPTEIKLNILNPQAYEIVWSPADLIVSGANSVNPVISSPEGKSVSLSLKHLDTGCIEQSDFDIKVTSPFDFNIIADNVICFLEPTNIQLTITNPDEYTYQWTPLNVILSGADSTNPLINISSDQTLNVKVTNKISGCSQSSDISVIAGENVVVDVDAVPDFTIFEGEPLDIFIKDPLSGANYVWSTGQTGISITVSPLETTSYIVTVTDINGCSATDEVTVTVRTAKCDETDVFIPNAFTPNNDGNNDIFRIRSNFIDELELIIYNRWGQEVFRTTDINTGWDGTLNGQELAPDAYAYYLRVLCVNAEEYKKKGNVTLLR